MNKKFCYSKNQEKNSKIAYVMVQKWPNKRKAHAFEIQQFFWKDVNERQSENTHNIKMKSVSADNHTFL